MSRVLSTEEAKIAIQRMQSIINNGLADQISQLDHEGMQLCNENVWDGVLAAKFRGEVWPNTRSALQKAQSELEELRAKLEQISNNIFAAGGE